MFQGPLRGQSIGQLLFRAVLTKAVVLLLAFYSTPTSTESSRHLIARKMVETRVLSSVPLFVMRMVRRIAGRAHVIPVHGPALREPRRAARQKSRIIEFV